MVKRFSGFLMAVCLTAAVGAAACTPHSAEAAGAAFEEKRIFTSGEDGYVLYRIPGIVVTGNGTLIAYCEARAARGDREPMDIVMKRSTDGGNTWGSRVKLADGVSTGDTMNNAVMIAEENSGTVHLVYSKNYARTYYRKSSNHGLTWSAPVDLTGVFEGYAPGYTVGAVAAGPGHGIQLKSGRLLIPFWITTNNNSFAISSVCTLYSDDGGATWNRGEILRETPVTVSNAEPTIVQLYDGSVMLNMRNGSPSKLRAVSTSASGTGGWSAPVLDEELVDQSCAGSLIRFTDKGSYHNNRLLFSNINNPSSRSNLTVKMSMDEGETWKYSKVICNTGAAYSDLAVSKDKNTIYCFYEKWEGTASYKYLTLARFNLEWLTNGEQSLDPLSGSPPVIPPVPSINVNEHWNSLSAWSLGGNGTKQISPEGQLHLYDNSGSGGFVERNDINIGQTYTFEFKAKIDDFTNDPIGVSPYPASLGTKIRDGVYRLMLDFRPDGIYAMDNHNAWTRVKAVSLNKDWYTWKVKVNHGIAEVFMDGISQCKFAMQSSSAGDTIQHWICGKSTDAAGAHIEYTRLYTEPLKSGPVGDWKFNEASGTNANDASGNANTGIVSGAVWSAGYRNNGLLFDGINDYVDAGKKSNLQFGKGDFTAAAWIKTNTVSSHRLIFWNGDVGNDKPQWWVKLEENNISFAVDGVSNPAVNYVKTDNGPIKVGVWHHVAVTRKGAVIKLYIDGVERKSVICSNVPDVTSTSNGLTIGKDKNGTTRYWNGMIDEVLIYDRALSAGEILDIYN